MRHETLQVTRPNSRYQQLLSLVSNRRKRHQTRTFLLEGVRPIDAALRAGWRFHATIVDRGAPLSTWARAIVASAGAPVHYEMSADLVASLSGKDSPSELLAVIDMPDDDVSRIPVGDDMLVVVADTPSSPGNLGTLIRSCDALGAAGIIVMGHAVDLYDPATITASRGSLFAVPAVRVDGPADVAAWLASTRATLGRCHVVGTDEGGAVAVDAHDFRQPTVILAGNESRGLSHACRDLCDVLVRIPMTGSASSLNLGVAASIVLYEAQRQRRTG